LRRCQCSRAGVNISNHNISKVNREKIISVRIANVNFAPLEVTILLQRR
jgi:hypothetical protein